MTTLSDSAEEQLSRSIRRRYRERAGAFAWLAFAIDHADVIEAHDRVDASIKQAPIFLAHLERWRQTTRRLASALDLNQLISLVATAQRSPIAESANVCDAIDHTMASIIDLPVLSELRETQEKMSCTLRDIRSAVADSTAPSSGLAQALSSKWTQRLCLIALIGEVDAALGRRLIYYDSHKGGRPPIAIQMAFRAAYEKRIMWHTVAALLVFTGRFEGTWGQLSEIARADFDERRGIDADASGPFDRKPFGRAPQRGMVLVRVRPFDQYGSFRVDDWTGKKTVAAIGGQWLWIPSDELARVRSAFFTEDEAAEHDARRREMDRTTPEFEKEIIVQWERRRNRVRDEFIHSMARLKLEGFSPSVKDRARQESLEAEGMAHLEKQMADALARFDVETPRPTKQKCDGCDAIFMPDHALDRYHSRDCANLTRQRRHADRAGKRAVDAEAVGQRRAMRKLEATGRRHRNQVHGGLHVPTCEMCMMFVDAMAAVAPTGTKPAEEKPTRKQHRNTAKRSSPAGDDDECGHDWDDDEGGGDGRFVCTKCGMARRVDPDGRIREI